MAQKDAICPSHSFARTMLSLCCPCAANVIISLQSWETYTGCQLSKVWDTKCCCSLIKFSIVNPLHISPSCCLCIHQTGPCDQKPKICSEIQDAVWKGLANAALSMLLHFFGTLSLHLLTHWGWVTHICIAYLTIIASDNGLSPSRCQAIIWTNAGILLFRPLGTNFSEILIEIHTFSFKKMHIKISTCEKVPILFRPQCVKHASSIDAFKSSQKICLYNVVYPLIQWFLFCMNILFVTLLVFSTYKHFWA